ncbi:single-stranded DNA-binding protein [Desemzia sp. RIT804]|uniref:single-stranded DNA-binding protein n=1 Tax=Desemzia sp. RIT 804 TaxID=2810209 RepID=UPI00194EEDC5|nr:single-stranded DNA-binding protein [Desemzia sp. RIT 804]MBM6614410.1 single-stranded DNA-binding protein [Desemzia sp. RIT 804]
MNQVSVIGRIVRDIELKDLGEGKQVVNNTIAIPMTFKKDSGQDTDFIPIVAWNKTAVLLHKYCKKGNLIGLTGRMQSRSYLNKENETVYVVELVVNTVQFLSNKAKEDISHSNQPVQIPDTPIFQTTENAATTTNAGN